MSQGLRSVGQHVYKASLVDWGQALRAKVHKKHSLCLPGRIKHLSGYWVSLAHVTASQSDPSSGTVCQRLTQQQPATGPSELLHLSPVSWSNPPQSHDLPLPQKFPGKSHLTVCLAPPPSISLLWVFQKSIFQERMLQRGLPVPHSCSRAKQLGNLSSGSQFSIVFLLKSDFLSAWLVLQSPYPEGSQPELTTAWDLAMTVGGGLGTSLSESLGRSSSTQKGDDDCRDPRGSPAAPRWHSRADSSGGVAF